MAKGWKFLPLGGQSSIAKTPSKIYRSGWIMRKESAMQLKIGVRQLNDGIVVVDCAGRIVFGEETAELRDQVKALITAGSRIILNLAEVTYIDTGGLGRRGARYTTARNAPRAGRLPRRTQRVR